MYIFKVVKGINGNIDYVCLPAPDVTVICGVEAPHPASRETERGSGRVGIGEHRYEERGGGR